MVVRMRHTRAHTKNRRAHRKLANPRFSVAETGAVHLRHRALLDGTPYRGHSVLDRTSKKAVKNVKKEEKKAGDKKSEKKEKDA